MQERKPEQSFQSDVLMLQEELKFTEQEAISLSYMKQHINGNSEQAERVKEHNRLLYARWMVEHGKFSEFMEPGEQIKDVQAQVQESMPAMTSAVVVSRPASQNPRQR